MSPAPGVPTVGELADRIATAWAGVRTYRSVFTTTQRIPGTPRPSLVTIEVTEDVILPDQKHRVTRENGAVVSELISVEGKLYARGVILTGVGTPQPDPNGWFVINPGSLEAGSPAASLYASFAAPATPPYSALSPEERMRDAVPLDQVEIAGRLCQRYRFADTTMTGERVEIVLALGPDDLPCSIETIAGGTDSRSVFTYNLPVTIVPPGLATPAVPAAG